MEHLILKVLSFDIAVPTANCFCEKFLRDGGVEAKTSALAMVSHVCLRFRGGGLVGFYACLKNPR